MHRPELQYGGVICRIEKSLGSRRKGLLCPLEHRSIATANFPSEKVRSVREAFHPHQIVIVLNTWHSTHSELVPEWGATGEMTDQHERREASVISITTH